MNCHLQIQQRIETALSKGATVVCYVCGGEGHLAKNCGGAKGNNR
jgi:hypothetical protein